MNYANDGPTEALLFSIATFSRIVVPFPRGGGGGVVSLCIEASDDAAKSKPRSSDSQWIWSRFVSSLREPSNVTNGRHFRLARTLYYRNSTSISAPTEIVRRSCRRDFAHRVYTYVLKCVLDTVLNLRFDLCITLFA